MPEKPSKKEAAQVAPESDDEQWQCCHRLHYRWSQLQADRCGVNVGSPLHPLPAPDRVLQPQPGKIYKRWPTAPSETATERDQFSRCSWIYTDMSYNTFTKNGALKLTEVEIHFLSRFMTRTSSSQWAVVYLGMGHGDRFRCLRDQFFPALTVVGFDPIDENYKRFRNYAHENARIWNADGTDFFFYVRCYEEKDVTWIRDKLSGKKLLLISDIRGIHKIGSQFNKHYDQDLQWQAIRGLRPVSSLVKFIVPEPENQFYEYPPGILLKQVYCNYGTTELRLMIDGVPQRLHRWNSWELYEKMCAHHEQWRGQVYETTRRSDCTACFDSCFDCTVLWNTLSTYAAQNSMDPYEILKDVIRHHVYTPSHLHDWGSSYKDYEWQAPSHSQRWEDVEWALARGKIMEAIAALEAPAGQNGADEPDWVEIAKPIATLQPELAAHLRQILRSPVVLSSARIAGRSIDRQRLAQLSRATRRGGSCAAWGVQPHEPSTARAHAYSLASTTPRQSADNSHFIRSGTVSTPRQSAESSHQIRSARVPGADDVAGYGSRAPRSSETFDPDCGNGGTGDSGFDAMPGSSLPSSRPGTGWGGGTGGVGGSAVPTLPLATGQPVPIGDSSGGETRNGSHTQRSQTWRSGVDRRPV